MSIFDTVVLVWLVSVVCVSAVGFFFGRTAEAFDMGILLGPIGVVVAVVMMSRDRKVHSDNVPIVRINEARKVAAQMPADMSMQKAA